MEKKNLEKLEKSLESLKKRYQYTFSMFSVAMYALIMGATVLITEWLFIPSDRNMVIVAVGGVMMGCGIGILVGRGWK